MHALIVVTARGDESTPARGKAGLPFLAGSEEAQLAGSPDRLLPPLDVELAVDRLQVGLDRVQRHVQLVADLPVRQAARQVAQDRQLPFAQRLDEGGAG